MNLLILDTETTGLILADGAELIEVGSILYSVPYRAILAQFSTLVPVKKAGQEDTHGISAEMANSVPYSVYSAAINLLSDMSLNADYAVAHNADFDKQFTPRFLDIPWLCTYEDFSFPPYKNSNLVSLALSHGIAVKSAHRALNDCSLIAEIFSKRDDLEALIDAAIARAESPKLWVEALVDYADKDKAKSARFEWKPETKQWVKLIKECDLETLTFDWKLIK